MEVFMVSDIIKIGTKIDIMPDDVASTENDDYNEEIQCEFEKEYERGYINGIIFYNKYFCSLTKFIYICQRCLSLNKRYLIITKVLSLIIPLIYMR